MISVNYHDFTYLSRQAIRQEGVVAVLASQKLHPTNGDELG
jgi:hypothetical protein